MSDHYSRALDEIYFTRLVAEHEAEVLEQLLDFKTFPKSRREVTENQIKRLRAIAAGRAIDAYMEARGASATFRNRAGRTTLTRHQFEAEE